MRKTYRERKKIFLAIDVLFSLSAMFFALWVIMKSSAADFPNTVLFAMTFSMGLSWAARVVEMLVTGKRKNFALSLVTSVFILSISVSGLWLYSSGT